ncbi:MAG: sensor histidine kinase [Phycisphaeraceae bacterium]
MGEQTPRPTGCFADAAWPATCGDELDGQCRACLDGESERPCRERVRQLAAELAIAEERERQRIAQDLHDGVCQLFAAMHIKLDLALQDRTLDRHPELHQSLTEISEILREANHATRSLSADLSPPILREMGFVAAVHWLGGRIERLYGLRTQVVAGQRRFELGSEAELLLFRCLRELLINAAKYAGVDQVIVRIARQDDRLRLHVRDRGAGFDPGGITPRHDGRGLGLRSIDDRIAGMGGRMTICSAPGEGTDVLLEIPLGEASPR